MGGAEEKKITADDIRECWGCRAYEYFADLLNGDCSIDETVLDLRSLIGSRYDPRCAAELVEAKPEQHTTQAVRQLEEPASARA